MMTELQRTLYSPALLPAAKGNAREHAEAAVAMLGEDVPAAKRALCAWMLNPNVVAFIRSIPQIRDEAAARLEYLDHLERAGCFETVARSARKAAEAIKDGGLLVTQKRVDIIKQRHGVPEWYKTYLKTDHWAGHAGVRAGAVIYYGSCVLCGIKTDLQIHHKHYNSLANEDTHDVSVLCDNHHKQITPLVGIYVPRTAPPSVMALFDHEGIDTAWLKEDKQ
jgi:hypothetical protein